MKWNSTFPLIAASALALIGLLLLQVKWMQQSRDLIEEQFEQKVKMAMCSAVDGVKSIQANPKICEDLESNFNCLQVSSEADYNNDELESSLADAFDFYGVPGPYEVNIINNACDGMDKDSPYCCSLAPLISSDEHLLSIHFPSKREYVRSRMSFMLISSILILLFIMTVFGGAVYTLLRQKRLHDISIDFFNNMAHELRTPLTNINLATHLLKKKHQELADDKFLQIVSTENKRMKHQVERVLHLAKLEKGNYQLQKEQVDICEILQEVVEGMEIQITEKAAKINMPVLSEKIEVYADKFHLSNVFRNLLDNALKYAGERPEINIAVQTTPEGVYIAFEDNGIGISPRDQELIFEKFQRVSTGNLHAQKGFGLGLSYVKMIMEGHQGFIKVFSELNKGSRFNLFLPAGG